MSYWKYRAYDANLIIQEGILIGPEGLESQVCDQIILRLRQQGLQVVSIAEATTVEYQREQQLQRLKNRLASPKPTH